MGLCVHLDTDGSLHSFLTLYDIFIMANSRVIVNVFEDSKFLNAYAFYR